MNFNKPIYSFETKDHKEVVGEAWEKGVRYFKIKDSLGNTEVIKSAGSEVICKDANFNKEEVMKSENKKPNVTAHAHDDILGQISALRAEVARLTSIIESKKDKNIVQS